LPGPALEEVGPAAAAEPVVAFEPIDRVDAFCADEMICMRRAADPFPP
jgi:hypothetical protein